MTFSHEEIYRRVKAIQKRNPCYATIAQWVGDLLAETVRAAQGSSISGPYPGQKKLPNVPAKGQALLDPSRLSLDWDQAGNLFKRLVTIACKTEKGRAQEDKLFKALAKDQKNSHLLMRAVLNSDLAIIESAARDLDVDPSVLTILIRMSLRPALLKTAQAARARLDLTKWSYGHCPVCGSQPGLAELSADGGKRTLHCSLCETAWPYPRLCCPFCENDDSESLSYMRAQNEPGLRVDLCGNCGRYIKTIDLRELEGPVIAPLDDAATWHLEGDQFKGGDCRKFAEGTHGKHRDKNCFSG